MYYCTYQTQKTDRPLCPSCSRTWGWKQSRAHYPEAPHTRRQNQWKQGWGGEPCLCPALGQVSWFETHKPDDYIILRAAPGHRVGQELWPVGIPPENWSYFRFLGSHHRRTECRSQQPWNGWGQANKHPDSSSLLVKVISQEPGSASSNNFV